ncbi:MAG: hypothetical protein L3J94_03560 [Gammaproteobacteria bacterium]|nr:hypothetical protein [Gammaproteobacteria bacterium]
MAAPTACCSSIGQAKKFEKKYLLLLWLNGRPRKKLGYKDSAKLMAAHVTAIAALAVMRFEVESAGLIFKVKFS